MTCPQLTNAARDDSTFAGQIYTKEYGLVDWNGDKISHALWNQFTKPVTWTLDVCPFGAILNKPHLWKSTGEITWEVPKNIPPGTLINWKLTMTDSGGCTISCIWSTRIHPTIVDGGEDDVAVCGEIYEKEFGITSLKGLTPPLKFSLISGPGHLKTNDTQGTLLYKFPKSTPDGEIFNYHISMEDANGCKAKTTWKTKIKCPRHLTRALETSGVPDCCNTSLGTKNCWQKCGNCPSCTPDCCGSVDWIFEVGDPSNFSTTVEEIKIKDIQKRINELKQYGINKIENLPSFSPMDGELLFSLGNTCSFPCSLTTITVTVTHYCCIYGTFIAVGDGLVYASSDVSSIPCCNLMVTPLVNGIPFVAWCNDGDQITISLQLDPIPGSSQAPGYCPCVCHFIRTVDPCEPYSTPLYIVRKNINGEKKMFLNTLEAIEKHTQEKRLSVLRKAAILRKNKGVTAQIDDPLRPQ